MRAASTTQNMSAQGGQTQTPGWNNATQAINNSNSSAMARQDAMSVRSVLSNFQTDNTPIHPNGSTNVSHSGTVGLASGTISISSWWETVGGGGILLSSTVPILNKVSLQQESSLSQGTSASDMEQMQSLAAIGIGNRVLFQSISFTITWPDASAPTLTITPATSGTIHIGDSVTFASVATHNENELIKHNFEWQLPGGQWAKDISGFSGTATVHASGTLNMAPNLEFGDTTQKTRSVTFTPLMQGLYVFRYAAADKLAGFGYSQQVAVMVENTVPNQALDIPSAVYVGGTSFSLTHTASNPTTLPGFLTGFRLWEQREDSQGNIYQSWQLLNEEAAASGNRSWANTRPAPDRAGTIRYHAYAWNQWMSETANVHEYTIQVPNRAPTIAWSITPASAQYGESVVVRASALDADNNLSAIHIDLNGSPHRHDGFTDGLTGSASGAYLDSYGLKPNVGSHTYTAVALDGMSASSGTISHTVTIVKATPNGALSGQSISEGTSLTGTHLSSSFTNPNDNSNAAASGTITYKIVSGGNAFFPNETILTPGMVLASGTYMIGATLAASQNYNEATATALFTVEANPGADNDGDGLINAIEAALGLNPNSSAEATPELLDVRIHTPTLENQ
jgi:hypothetical protein